MPVPGFEKTRAKVDSLLAGGFGQPMGGGAVERFGRIPQGRGQPVALGHEFGKQNQLRALTVGLFGHLRGAGQVFVNFAILAGDLHGSEG